MSILHLKAVTLFSIMADSILVILAGAPVPPLWNTPQNTRFTFEFTDSSGCENVTSLSATPQLGTSISFSVISQGPEGGFGTERIDDTTAKLTCDQTRIVDGTFYNVNVRATDPVPNEFSDINLVIKASKISTTDKQPVFITPNPDPTSSNHAVTLAETAKGGDTVLWLSAADPDTAIAFLTYSMAESDATTKGLFQLDGNKLSVKTDVAVGTFDYDKEGAVRQYPISLRVSDGTFSSLLNTNINIQDVNDNAPVFQTIAIQNVYETTSAGSDVFRVTATDADGSPENSQVKYSMAGSTDFTIGETTGVVSVALGITFNYDVTSKYILSVTARDDVGKRSDAEVTVNIITAPKFVNLAIDTTANVNEDAPAETSIFELTVADKDQTSLPTVTIDSQTPDEMFRLDGYVLKPKVGVTLDANARSTYELRFSASDGIREVVSAVLSVNVIKVETTTPKVNTAVVRYMSENAQPGTFVTRVDSVGLNNQNDIVFSMNGGKGDFYIKPDTGRVTVAQGVQLDYTVNSDYTLLVTATDGESRIVTPIVLYIKTAPVFTDPADSSPATTLISIPENTTPRTVIKSLTAMDEDGDSVTYNIVTQTPNTNKPVFEINGSNLRAAKSNTLDTFDVDVDGAVQTYILQIRVSDGRPITVDNTVDVTIAITDSNEPPVFPVEEYPSQIVLESTREGSVVFTVTAKDGDRTLENRKIRYSLSGTTSFKVNPDTGDIALAIGTALNQTETPVYSFTVIATDGGVPEMASSVRVTFSISRDGCNKLIDEYGTWPLTKIGNTAVIECKDLYEGNISRVCGADGDWGAVSSQCKVKGDVFRELKQQLDLLSSSMDDVSADIESISKNLTEITSVKADGDIITNVVGLSQDIVRVVENTNSVTDNSTEYFFESISNLVMPDNEDAWNKTEVQGSAVLDVVDRYLAVIQEIKCNGLNDGEVNEVDKDHIYVEVGRKSGIVTFPNIKQVGSAIDIPEDTFKNKGISDVCFGGSLYSSIGDLLEKQVENRGTVSGFSNGQEVNSEVISIQLQQKPGVTFDNLYPPVRVTLSLLNENLSYPVCVFWDYNITNVLGGKGAWSPTGCQIVNITNTSATCECTHLTNFAILMSPSSISDKHSKILGIISAVGCAVSMVCLILTIAAHFMVWRVVRSNRTITLMHLCVALLLALGIFLAGVNRTESPEACAVIAALIQYLFLTVFFLMLLIGIEILLSVTQVFGTKFPVTKLLPFAWSPAVIVGISMGVTKAEGYGNDSFCWLDIDSGLIWSFIGPVLLVILVNGFIVCAVFKKMASSTVMKSKTSKMRIKTSLRSLCVLLPVMGLTWLLGILSVNSDLFILQYFFSICNTLQGLLIFLFHCVFNRQIRGALKLRKDRRKTLETFTSEFRNPKEEQSRGLEKSQKLSFSDGFDNNA